MKALQSGGTQGAMTHLKVADKILGWTGYLVLPVE
jgi:hypothetical protein